MIVFARRALAVAGLGLSTTVLPAQSSVATTTATVVTPITIAGLAPLSFGNVFRGINRTIAWNNVASGRFNVAGHATSQVRVTFTLPTTLSNGFATMPINQYRIRVNGTNTTAGAAIITATSGVPFNRNLVAGALWFFVGARVQPSTTQAPGTYAAPIVLSAAYTGL